MNGVLPEVTPRVARITPARRVRHEVRDGLLVMGFSLSASSVLALVLLGLSRLGG